MFRRRREGRIAKKIERENRRGGVKEESGG